MTNPTQFMRALSDSLDTQMPSWDLMDLSQLQRYLDHCGDLTTKLIDLLPFMAARKRFGCSNLREAILLLEPSISNKEALKQAALHLFLPDEGEISLEQAQMGLWFAAYTGDVAIAQDALLCGAEINTPLYPGMSPLLLACKQGHSDLVHFLLHKGANVKFIGGTHDHETPYSEAKLRLGFNKRCLQRLKRLDQGFSKDWHAKKRLVHAFSLGQFPSLQGYRPRYVLNHYIRKSKSFYARLKQQFLTGAGLFEQMTLSLSQESKKKLQDPAVKAQICTALDELQDAFSQLYHSNLRINPAEIEKRLDQGKPVLCFGITRTGDVWNGQYPNSHAWGLVITKDPASNDFIVQKCDRRGHNGSFKGIQIKKMNRENLNALINLYAKATDWKVDFLNEGNEIAENLAQYFNTSPNKSIPEKGQTIGNCCYYNMQSMELALLYALFVPLLGDEDALALARGVKSERTARTRQNELKNFTEKHVLTTTTSHPILNPKKELIVSLLNKIDKKPKLVPFQAQLLSSSLNLDQLIQEYGIQVIWRTVFLYVSREPGAPKRYASSDEIRSSLIENPKYIEKITHLSCDTPLKFASLFAPFPSIIHSFSHLKEMKLKCSLNSLPPLSLPQLERLDLNNNQLTSISTLDLPKLTNLDLSHNQLTTLPQGLSLKALTHLFLNHNQLIAFPDDLIAPELVSLKISENCLQSAPSLPFPKLNSTSTDKSDLIKSFFTSSDMHTDVPNEEVIDFIFSLFASMTNPRVQINTLESLYGFKNITEAILQRLYNAIAFDKLEDVFCLLTEHEDLVREKKADFIQSCFQFQTSLDAPIFPSPSEEQLQILLTLFKSITARPHLLDVMVRVMTAPNSNPMIARSFYDLLPEEMKATIQKTILEERASSDLYVPDLAPIGSEEDIKGTLIDLYYKIWNEL